MSLTSLSSSAPLLCLTLLALAMVFAGCHASHGSSHDASNPSDGRSNAGIALRGTTWDLTELMGEALVQSDRPRGPYLRIDPVEPRYNGNATLNSIFGPAEVDGDSLRLKSGGMTKMAGPTELMQQEGKFVAMLDLVRSYRIDASSLILLDAKGNAVARLLAQKP